MGARYASHDMLLDLPLENGLRHRTDDGVYVPAVLEEEYAWNRANVEAHGRALIAVHVQLGNPGLAGIFAGQLVQDRRHDLAGAAPRRPEVYQHEPRRLLDLAGKSGVGDFDGVGGAHDVILRSKCIKYSEETSCPTAPALLTSASPYPIWMQRLP